MKSERRTVQETLGRAMNSSSLRTEGRAPGAETSLLQVAALGAAALHVLHGADRQRLPVAAVIAQPNHVPDPQDVLSAELASVLLHVRDGGQHGYIARAIKLFAAWMGYRGRFNTLAPAERDLLLHRLATRALHEWLSNRCVVCRGSGKQERSKTGAWLTPRGSMQRNATFRTCPACDGSRRQAVSHAQRVSALGITRARYDSERWDAHCKAAISWLNMRLAPKLNRALTVQLERSKKRV